MANISQPPNEEDEDDSSEITQLQGIPIPSWEEMQMKAVPSCLSSQLREVEIFWYRGLDAELLLVKYLLLNSKVLSKMHFKKLACEVNKIAKELQDFPRSSET